LLILGIDTSTRQGSVGIVRIDAASAPGSATRGDFEILAERTSDAGLQHAEALMPLIDDCLAAGAIDLDALDAVAVSIGPGSFTGLRVGLATAKGLVLGTRTAIVGVPTLAALAATLVGRATGEQTGGVRRLVCPCLDARRGEVYGALFALDSGATSPADSSALERILEDSVAPPEALAASIAAALERTPETAPLVLIGDGAERHAERLRAGLGAVASVVARSEARSTGGCVAALGARAWRERGSDDVVSLAPLYARASDAERVRAAREAGGPAPDGRR